LRYVGIMPARLPSLMFVRLWAALLLATIGLHAAMPAPAVAFERTHGSAFAANRHEVALIVQRGEKVARQAVGPQPRLLPALATATDTFRPVGEAIRSPDPMPLPAATAPPLRPIRSWKPAPRAPPHA
jgi:hypothetical protein